MKEKKQFRRQISIDLPSSDKQLLRIINHFSNIEDTYILLILGECHGLKIYVEKFPNPHHPNRRTILAVEQRCRKTWFINL